MKQIPRTTLYQRGTGYSAAQLAELRYWQDKLAEARANGAGKDRRDDYARAPGAKAAAAAAAFRSAKKKR